MRALRGLSVAAALLAASLMGGASARADFVYTFTAGSFGKLEFAVDSIIPDNTDTIPITEFILGSLAPPDFAFTASGEFAFQDATTDLGFTRDYQFLFSSIPSGVGDFTPFQTVADHTELSGDLVITERTSVPEPVTGLLLGSGIAGIVAVRRKRRRTER